MAMRLLHLSSGPTLAYSSLLPFLRKAFLISILELISSGMLINPTYYQSPITFKLPPWTSVKCYSLKIYFKWVQMQNRKIPIYNSIYRSVFHCLKQGDFSHIDLFFSEMKDLKVPSSIKSFNQTCFLCSL